MGIILDSSVIISGERGAFQLESWLSNHPSEIELAAITVAELWHGVVRATPQHRVRREAYVRRVIDLLPIIPYTERTAFEHARIWAELAQEGRMTGYYDIIVAATAIERDCEVATLNTKHFAGIRGLKLAKLRGAILE